MWFYRGFSSACNSAFNYQLWSIQLTELESKVAEHGQKKKVRRNVHRASPSPENSCVVVGEVWVMRAAAMGAAHVIAPLTTNYGSSVGQSHTAGL